MRSDDDKLPIRDVSTAFAVRRARASDATALLAMMRELAEVERYLDAFRVTAQDLLDRGFNAQQAPQFVAFVAEHEATGLAGYAIVYEIPFTYDLRPNLVLKELYVCPDVRGLSIGRSLMAAVLDHAKTRGCARLKWEVLPDNESAKRFYGRIGGVQDLQWENWVFLLPDPCQASQCCRGASDE